MKKLWAVEVEFRDVVVSEGATSQEAENNVDTEDVWRDNCYHSTSLWASPIKGIADLPEGWKDQVPFGDLDDQTCEEIVQVIEEERKKKEAEEYMDKFQLKLDLDT